LSFDKTKITLDRSRKTAGGFDQLQKVGDVHQKEYRSKNYWYTVSNKLYNA